MLLSTPLLEFSNQKSRMAGSHGTYASNTLTLGNSMKGEHKLPISSYSLYKHCGYVQSSQNVGDHVQTSISERVPRNAKKSMRGSNACELLCVTKEEEKGG